MVQLTLRDCVPFFIMAFQCFIFFGVESVEMKIALAVVFAFQIWQKSRTKKVAEVDQEHDGPATATAAAPKRRNKKKE